MLLSLRKNRLTSLFKEVRVFKVRLRQSLPAKQVLNLLLRLRSKLHRKLRPRLRPSERKLHGNNVKMKECRQLPPPIKGEKKKVARERQKIFPRGVTVPFSQTLHFLGKQSIPRERESYFQEKKFAQFSLKKHISTQKMLKEY